MASVRDLQNPVLLQHLQKRQWLLHNLHGLPFSRAKLSMQLGNSLEPLIPILKTTSPGKQNLALQSTP
jgi:hypothetical protein